MAASAAKFAHCIVRGPVEYRQRTGLRGEIPAPADLSRRTAELYTLDRELDRSLPGPRQASRILEDLEAADTVQEGPTPANGAGGLVGLLREPWWQHGSRRGWVETVRLRLQLQSAGLRFRPPWTLNELQEVHGLVLSGTDRTSTTGGFRREAFTVLGPDGGTVYRACPPDRIQAELSDLLEWVERVGPTLMPVIPATVLLHGLQTIRPFDSGNVDLGRVVFETYLEQSGLQNIALVPWAALMSSDESLRGQLLLWTESSGSYRELVDQSVDALGLAYRTGVDRWLRHGSGQDDLEETAVRVLARARREPGWFSSQDAVRWAGAGSVRSLHRHLGELVRRGLIETMGQTRAKRFRQVPISTTSLPLWDRRLARLGRARTPASPTTPAPAGAEPLAANLS